MAVDKRVLKYWSQYVTTPTPSKIIFESMTASPHAGVRPESSIFFSTAVPDHVMDFEPSNIHSQNVPFPKPGN